MQAGTALGRSGQATIDSGKLVGDDAMIDIVRERLSARTPAQGSCWMVSRGRSSRPTALDGLVGRGPLVVLDIVVPEEVLVQRLATRRICGGAARTRARSAGGLHAMRRLAGHRTDDGDGIVRERLKVYQRQTKPLVEYYAARPTFRSIDGNQPPDAVTAAIDAAICEASRRGGARHS